MWLQDWEQALCWMGLRAGAFHSPVQEILTENHLPRASCWHGLTRGKDVLDVGNSMREGESPG